ncbi:lysophosphatidic acid receptor 2-like [Oculina patagonica]
MFSLPECITWLAVGLTESVATVVLNAITSIAVIKNHNLRKRSMYLVISLAVADMLAGGFAAYEVFYWVGVQCNVLKYKSVKSLASFYLLSVLLRFFPVSSVTHISAISLERLNATFWPFRHRVLKKWVYGFIIIGVWVTALLLSIALVVVLQFEEVSYLYNLWISFYSICLLIISVSYASIVIKVRCGPQPQHHGAASRERKLTMTLLIVTVVSLLLYLPYIIFQIPSELGISKLWLARLSNIIMALYYANSLVNPTLYAIRMPEYRSPVLALFRRRPQQQRQAVVLPLHGM